MLAFGNTVWGLHPVAGAPRVGKATLTPSSHHRVCPRSPSKDNLEQVQEIPTSSWPSRSTMALRGSVLLFDMSGIGSVLQELWAASSRKLSLPAHAERQVCVHGDAVA
jgi:hypothetical protein